VSIRPRRAKTGLRLDHVVIVVADLAGAQADFEALGFRVALGGRHTATPTHNALIVFADGTYVELFAPLDGKSPQTSRDPWLARLARGEGMIAYALTCGSLPSALPEAVDLEWETEEDGRETPEGEELRWRVLFPNAAEGLAPLPFFIQDLTPRESRVPSTGADRHGLPVLGIECVRVACLDVERTAGQMSTLLGLEPVEGSVRDSLRFVLEGEPTQVIEVVGRESDVRAADHLAELGEGPCEVILSPHPGAGAAQTHLLDGALHGVCVQTAAAHESHA
jgi:catechol 2,3-dioxygenase-like lactoylglutathione lyase family enzyme